MLDQLWFCSVLEHACLAPGAQAVAGYWHRLVRRRDLLMLMLSCDAVPLYAGVDSALHAVYIT